MEKRRERVRADGLIVEMAGIEESAGAAVSRAALASEDAAKGVPPPSPSSGTFPAPGTPGWQVGWPATKNVSRREGARRGADGAREVEVVALCGGVSKNGYLYRQGLLRSLAGLLEGARAFADHPGPQDRPERSVRDLIGYYRQARMEEQGPGGAPEGARVVATLHVLESAGWLWSLIEEMQAEGAPGLVGLSVDLEGRVEPRRDANGQAVQEVTEITRLNSCDVVTRPSAGGAILGRRRESVQPQLGDREGWLVMGEPGQVMESTSEKEGEATVKTVRIREESGWIAGRSEGKSGAEASGGDDLEALRAEAQRSLEAARRAQRLAECELLLGRRLMESRLPEPVTAKLRRRFEGLIFEAELLEKAITEEREVVVALTNLGLIREMGYEKPQVSAMVTEAEKV